MSGPRRQHLSTGQLGGSLGSLQTGVARSHGPMRVGKLGPRMGVGEAGPSL